MSTPTVARPSLDDELHAATQGNVRSIGRLVSAVENADATVLAAIATRKVGAPLVVGLTGPPGVGKSTATDGLIAHYRAAGRTVAVLAIDPTSPLTGGAILGDRIRMLRHVKDPGVYIRSFAARRQLGGLAETTETAIRLLAVIGFDIILVETVGIGQSEVDIARVASTTVVLVSPRGGDGMQAVKAGVLEIADIFVVNKAELPGAEETVRDLTEALAHRRPAPDSWRPPIVRASAATPGGLDDLAIALEQHREWLEHHPVQPGQVRAELVRRALKDAAVDRFRRALAVPDDAVARVLEGVTPVDAVIDELVLLGRSSRPITL